MQPTKAGLLVACFSVAVMGGCATGTQTPSPVDDRSGAGTQPLPESSPPSSGALAGTASDQLAQRRIYFAFDSSSLDSENRAIAEAHAAHLVANPRLKIHLEGNADERGSREYNLALGERRAQAVERIMQALGVSAKNVTTVSYGEEKPIALEHNESAWRQNRRVEIVYR